MTKTLTEDELFGPNWREESERKRQEARQRAMGALQRHGLRVANMSDFEQARMENKQRRKKKKRNKLDSKGRELEWVIQGRIVKHLKKVGATDIQRRNSGNITTERGHYVKMSNRGTSDLHCVFNGKKYALEVKRPNPRTVASDDQRDYLNMKAEHGFVCAVVRSVEDVMFVLEHGKVGEVVMW